MTNTGDDEKRKLLDLYIHRLGIDGVLDQLSRLDADAKRRTPNVLTIVSNAGVHHLPDEVRRGDVYVVSEGNLDFSSSRTIAEEYRKCLKRLAKKLKEKKWDEVYIVPFGHSTLSMQIKLLVYRITRIETVDWHYSKGVYQKLTFDQRDIIVDASS